jgi:hypothetical protein
VQRDIPLEFVVSAAVCIILVYCPIAPNSPSVIFFTEQAETIADPTKRLPGVLQPLDALKKTDQQKGNH